MPRLMTGTQPVKVTNSKIITFRKLKITTTSHMQVIVCFSSKIRVILLGIAMIRNEA